MRESMRRLAFDDGEEKAVRGVRRVRVELLDGDHITIEVHRKARGEDLLDRICEDLDVAEKDYFGLLHLQRGDPRVWVDLNKRLSKTFRNEPWEVMFAVKFYPPEPTALEDEVSRYQIGLAVKKDIAEGRLPCSPITLALLSSYELQAAAGDHGAGCQCGALLAAAPPPPAPLARSALQDNVHALYLKHRGMSPAQAELQYLASAARLPLYGAHTHAARDVTLALSAAGLALCNEGYRHYTPHTSRLTPHVSHLTPHVSHLTSHTSRLTPHTSRLTPHVSRLTPHTSHLTPHTSHLTPHTSHLTPYTSHLMYESCIVYGTRVFCTIHDSYTSHAKKCTFTFILR
ncbi:protein 4.1 homolog isoform X1 [Bombyx mori]|uniref:protein 4.1 homolog isoform X1 n=1 Tax=Bombyx mori TaxID=7091 RepID=UPI002ED16C48